jgi:hypothetical protein
MAETSSRIPEEDRPQIQPGELDARERAGGGLRPRQRGEHSGTGSAPRGRSRGGQVSGTSRRPRGDHSGAGSGTPSGSGGEQTEPRGFYRPDELEDQEQSSEEHAPGDNFSYNDNPERQGLDRLRYGKDGKSRFNFSKRNKVIAAVISGFISLIVTMVTFFLPSGFTLPNFLKNAEDAGFQRYQVDINTRSTAWLQAYMDLRFGEIEDPNLAPGDRDNVFFRADNVKNNQFIRDWYRTLRTSNFEQDLFERRGIKFTSEAYRAADGTIKFRAAKLTLPDSTVTFDPRQLGYGELDALSQGDINKLNGRLSDTFDVERYSSNKEARTAIKGMLKEEYPQWWKAVKRYHLRQDIQNMIGVRSWKFFENTRSKIHAKKVAIRNKIITQSLPEDSKSGAFVRCLFGIDECKASGDYANPENSQLPDSGAKKSDGNPNDPNQTEKTYGTDPKNPETISGSAGTDAIQSGVDAAATSGKIAAKILSKLNVYNNILSFLDMLARFDQAMHNHSLSLIVSQAKSQMFMGLFTTFSVASDQLTTGQVNSDEVRSFMDKFARPTHGEGWTAVVEGQQDNTVSAASTKYVDAKNKQEFCSPKHQQEMQDNPAEAEKEFQWLCPQDTVGGANNASTLEDTWNSTGGAVLHPFLKIFHSVTGGFFDVFNSITSAITDPIVNAALDATGTQKDVQNAMAYVGAQAIRIGGAALPVDNNTPSGQVANYNIEGAAVGGEMAMRNQGGAATTESARALATKNVLAYEQEQQANASFADRYLSTSNPKSFISTQLFAISDFKYSNFGQDLINIFASAFTGPWRVLTQPTHAAAPDGYAAARFAKLDTTYDMPAQCLNAKPLDETPQSVTNADDLGYFKPDELTWDLVTNYQDWYKALYDKVGGDDSKAEQVWNCALMDNTVRGGIGAQYGYKGANSFDDGSGSTSNPAPDPTTGTVVSGDAQQIAKDILSNSNITYQYSAKDDVQLISEGKNGTNGYPIDIRLLQIVAALGQNHKVDVSAFESYGQGHSSGSDHYTGHAVDLASIDGETAYKNVFQFFDEFKPYSKGSIFLQKQCGGTAPPPDSGVEWLAEDACTHQHISVGPAN